MSGNDDYLPRETDGRDHRSDPMRPPPEERPSLVLTVCSILAALALVTALFPG